jgi:putative two-component system response regulator
MNLAPPSVRNIEIAAKLHDLATGFTGREALYKAKLDESERNLIRKHAEIGAEILRGAGFDEEVYRAVRGHHERWDGGGYPDGTTGSDTPLAARIIALPEVFDAFTSARPWREPLPITKAVQSLLEGAGTQFDPDVVSAFLAAWWNSSPKHERRFITYES